MNVLKGGGCLSSRIYMIKKVIVILLIAVAIIAISLGYFYFTNKKEAHQNVVTKVVHQEQNVKHDNVRQIVKTNTIVKIKSYSSAPSSLNEKSTLILGDRESAEFVEIKIEGKIKNFKYLSIGFENDALVEKDLIQEYNELENSTIVIGTTIPEGVPFEKIKWQNETGKNYEFIIHYNGENNVIDESMTLE